MFAKYILAGLAVGFMVARSIRLRSGTRHGAVQARTWLIIAVLFGIVSAWLFYEG